jgi:hypothetical protein
MTCDDFPIAVGKLFNVSKNHPSMPHLISQAVQSKKSRSVEVRREEALKKILESSTLIQIHFVENAYHDS